MPLDCEQIRNEFSALLDDELNSEDRELVEEHLSDCSDCLRELHGYQQVSDAYRYHHPVKAPADFEDLLRERMAPAAGRRGLPARTWLSLAAAAGVTLVAGIILWQKPLPEAAFQLSKNEPERIENAPMREELAPAPRDLDATGPAAGDDVAPGTYGAREAADEPQMSAFSAAVPEADAAEEESSLEVQDGIPAPAEPQMKQFTPADEAASSAANENALALKSVPPATEADGAPMALGRARALEQPEAASPLADDAESTVEAEPEVARAAGAPPETPPAESAPEGQQEMTVASALADAAPEEGETATMETREDGESAIRWREHSFTLKDGKWRQDGYAGEKTTRVLIPSDAWNKLLDEHQDLNKLVTHEEAVVVRLGETWYDIRRAKPAPETSPETPADQGR